MSAEPEVKAAGYDFWNGRDWAAPPQRTDQPGVLRLRFWGEKGALGHCAVLNWQWRPKTLLLDYLFIRQFGWASAPEPDYATA